MTHIYSNYLLKDRKRKTRAKSAYLYNLYRCTPLKVVINSISLGMQAISDKISNTLHQLGQIKHDQQWGKNIIIAKGSSLVPIKGNSFSERLVDVELVPGGGMNLENIILTHLSLPALLWMHACTSKQQCRWQCVSGNIYSFTTYLVLPSSVMK